MRKEEIWHIDDDHEDDVLLDVNDLVDDEDDLRSFYVLALGCRDALQETLYHRY